MRTHDLNASLAHEDQSVAKFGWRGKAKSGLSTVCTWSEKMETQNGRRRAAHGGKCIVRLWKRVMYFRWCAVAPINIFRRGHSHNLGCEALLGRPPFRAETLLMKTQPSTRRCATELWWLPRFHVEWCAVFCFCFVSNNTTSAVADTKTLVPQNEPPAHMN